MKKKKVISLILTLMLLTTAFSGCGKKTEKVNETTKSETVTTEPTKEAEPTEEATGEATPEATEEAAKLDISEPVTLTWYQNGCSVTDDTDVLEKVNAILKDKLNVTLKVRWGAWGEFYENVVLAINGNDDVDIYFTSSWSTDEYNMYARKGAWRRLDKDDDNLLEKYGSDCWNLLPEILRKCAKIEGNDGKGVYAIPIYKDYATQNCWDVNVPLLKEYGFTLDDVRNTDYYGLGDIMKKVKEGKGDSFYPLLCEGAVLERMATNTIIVTGDSPSNNILSYYLNPTDVTAESPQGNQIFSKFGSAEYKKFVDKTREYFEAGYIDPAMGNKNQANASRTAKQNTGAYLFNTQSYALGYETTESQRRGFEVAMIPTMDPYIDTSASQGALYAVSTTCKHPERAVAFLNLVNTDAELLNLITFGIEGEHYTMENGGMRVTDKRANYNPWRNGVGNNTLYNIVEGQPADFNQQFIDYYATAKEISINGFVFDSTKVSTQLGALANVAAEYALALNTGTVDPAKKLDAFNKKLEKTGIQKVVDEANAQLAKFLETK